MCHVWQNPSIPAEEINLKTLEKVPFGIDNLNITGGEPTLRNDLFDMVEILYPRARKLEISSNGLHPEKIEPIIKKYPDVKVRFSLEGFVETNDRLRGEEDGFTTKVNGLRRLKELGGCDLGFAITIQDDNAADLAGIYKMTQEMGVELATSALHNGFQFHKNDNYPYNREKVAKEIEKLIVEMLKTNSVKDWFRAYLNLGLIEKNLGQDRLIPCTAGTDFIFVDPWSDVYACNVWPDLKIGNLENQNWQEIFTGPDSEKVRGMVDRCKQNCWMVGSARTAMRNPKFTKLPKWKPFWWVLTQKARVTLGLDIPFDHFVDFTSSSKFPSGEKRESFLGVGQIKRTVQKKTDPHYVQFGPFDNR
jgi:MoaA/NifB/PqqE/SkfB family radical SAM enzyme